MRTIHLFTALLFFVVHAHAQVMPSPDASALVRQVNAPVNNYTGIASVSVPLYDMATNSGSQIPIALQYNTGGIKVEEVASVAGLGWNLQAGGAITRVMRHHADDQAKFVTPDRNSMYHTHFAGNSDYDYEKDVFYFNYPGGSGKFIFSGSPDMRNLSNGTTITNLETLPKSDIKISYTYYDGTSRDPEWVITDLMGVSYHFNGVVDKTRVNSRIKPNAFDISKEEEFISTWHLNRIEYPNSGYGVSFEYTAPVQLTELSSRVEKRLNTPVNNTYSLHGVVLDREIQRVMTTHYLSAINDLRHRITFHYSSRSDLINGKRLTQVRVTPTGSSTAVKTIYLNQGYFDSNDSYYKGGKRGNTISTHRYRLKLNSVTANGQIIQSFDYLNNKQFHSSTGYDLYELPPRDSYYYDHWGYFNGGDHHDTYAGEKLYVSHSHHTSPYLKGMKRNPTEVCKANMLYKVNYPSGGHLQMTYAYNVKNGGVRISTIEEKDETGNTVSRQRYVYNNSHENDAIAHSYIVEHSVDNDGSSLQDFVHSHAPASIYDLNGLTSGFRQMEVHDDVNGGYTRHFFYSNEGANALVPSEKAVMYISHKAQYGYGQPGENLGQWTYAQATSFSVHNEHIHPFTTHNLTNYLLGVEKKVETYDKNGKKIQEVENQYIQSAFTSTIKNHAINPYKDATEGGFNSTHTFYYVDSRYDIKNRYVFLDQTISRIFDDAGSEVSQQEVNYNYPSDYERSLPTFITTIEKDDADRIIRQSIQKTYYTRRAMSISGIIQGDFPNYSSVLGAMKNSHMLGYPIYTETRVNLPHYPSNEYRASGASLFTYQLVYGRYQPYQTFATELSNPTVSVINSDALHLVNTYSYNNAGLLISERDATNVSQKYQYDSKGNMISKTLDPGPLTAERTTTYQYYPLIGQKKVTYPDGTSMEYEYDSRNRLVLTKDHNGDIIQRYRYKYANEDDSPTINLNVIDWLSVDPNENSLELSYPIVEVEVGDYVYPGSTTNGDFQWTISGHLISNQLDVNFYYDIYSGRYIFDNIANPVTEPVTLQTSGPISYFEGDFTGDLTTTVTFTTLDYPEKTSTKTIDVTSPLMVSSIEMPNTLCNPLMNSNGSPTNYNQQLPVLNFSCEVVSTQGGSPCNNLQYSWYIMDDAGQPIVNFYSGYNPQAAFPVGLLGQFQLIGTYYIMIYVQDGCTGKNIRSFKAPLEIIGADMCGN